MAYLTAAKKAEIVKKYDTTLEKTSLAYLLDEMGLMEATIAAGGGIDWAEAAEIADVAATEAAGTSVEFARGDHAHALGSGVVDGTTVELNAGALRVKDGGIGSAKIATGAVTGAKIAGAGVFLSAVAAGAAAAGPVTLTGADVGDKVIQIINLTDAANGAADFESTITVEDQIQQGNAGNLTTKTFSFLLLKQS